MNKNLNLYNKYRPHSFKEIIGQEMVKNLLYQTFMPSKNIQSFIFFGSNGTGKTSMARIYAKALNCLNFEKNNDVCNECNNCKLIDSFQTMDICEVDAASHTGVDHMRELIQNSHYMALDLKKKVYLIDECHNLSSSAWSALLKTIEEPPSPNVVFIFLTTNIYKIPETIISRCQKYNFLRIHDEYLIELIDRVLEGENRSFSEEAKNITVNLSNGSARECLSLIETILLSTNSEEVSLEEVERIFSLSNKQEILNLSKYLFTNRLDESFKLIDSLIESNKNLLNFTSELLTTLMDLYVYKLTSNIDLLKKLNEGEIREFGDYQIDLMKYIEILETSVTFYEKTYDKKQWMKITLFKLWECNKGDSSRKIVKEEVKVAKKRVNRRKLFEGEEVYELPKDLEYQAVYGLQKDKLIRDKSEENRIIWRDFTESTMDKSEFSEELRNLLKKINTEFSFFVSDKTIIISFDNHLDAKSFNGLYLKESVKKELEEVFMHNLIWIALPKSQLNNYKQKSKNFSITEKEEKEIFDLHHKKNLLDRITKILT